MQRRYLLEVFLRHRLLPWRCNVSLQMQKYTPTTLVALTVAFCFLAACEHKETPGDAKSAPSATEVKPVDPVKAPNGEIVLGADSPEMKGVSIEAVRSVPLPVDEVTAPAKIEANPNRVSHAVLPVPGRIVKVMAKLGDAVVKGQPVVVIESPAAAEAETTYLQSESAVRQAQLAQTKAESDLARLTDLFQHDAVAKKEVLSAETTLGLSKAAVEQSQSAREQAKQKLELLGLTAGKVRQQITVTSPISGKVLEVSVVEGEFHNEINAPMLTVADLSRVWATSEVPESDIRHYKAGGGAVIELIAFPNQTFRATITRIADLVDKETRTVRVNAELDNGAGHLMPEMFGRLKYTGAVEPSPWLPDMAVIQVEGRDHVFVEVSPGHFRLTPVTLGRRHDGGSAVAAGVKAGDRVVTRGTVYLKAAL